MSSRKYVGRHRPAHAKAGARVQWAPKTLTAGFVLPTAAAAALVVSATGVSVAENRTGFSGTPNAFGLTNASQVSQTIRAQSIEVSADAQSVSDRRNDATTSRAALEGREQEANRIARTRARALDKARRAAAAAAAAEAEARAHDWVMPVEGASFTSGYKYRWGRMHTGNDLAIAEGAPLYAMSTGEVIYTGWMGGGGNTTKIRYWDGTVSYYEHQSAILVSVGQQVAPGDLVGRVGNTGHSFGAHLHLEIHPDGGGPIDPYPWMQAKGLYY